MSEAFKWRGWEGTCFQRTSEDGVARYTVALGGWVATVWIHGVKFQDVGSTRRKAIGKCRRKLDNVRHAMWFTHRADGDSPERKRY